MCGYFVVCLDTFCGNIWTSASFRCVSLFCVSLSSASSALLQIRWVILIFCGSITVDLRCCVCVEFLVAGLITVHFRVVFVPVELVNTRTGGFKRVRELFA